MTNPIYITAVLLMTALANVAHADVYSESGAYVGLKAGGWKFTGDDVGDLGNSSFGAFGGYQFHPGLAIELDYLVNTRATTGNALETKSAESNSYFLSLRPIIPINENWELFAKVGYEYYQYTETITQKDGSSKQIEGDETTFATGVGAAWNKYPFHFRAEVQASQSLTGNAVDFWIYSMGIAYKF